MEVRVGVGRGCPDLTCRRHLPLVSPPPVGLLRTSHISAPGFERTRRFVAEFSHHGGLGGVRVSLPRPSWRRKRQAHAPGPRFSSSRRITAALELQLVAAGTEGDCPRPGGRRILPRPRHGRRLPPRRPRVFLTGLTHGGAGSRLLEWGAGAPRRRHRPAGAVVTQRGWGAGR